jgi:undecaprenyl-diphosphatase
MEQQLQILINREWISPCSDRIMAFVADFGAWAPWLLGLLVIGVIFGDFKFRTMLLTAGVAIGLSDGIGVNLLKHTVNRPRPSQVEPGVRMVSLGKAPHSLPKVLGLFSEPVIAYPHGSEPPQVPGMLTKEKPATGRSFPSGHASNNMAVAIVLILFYRRRGWLYLPIALLIAYSRVYTGSHWPLDILGGMILGGSSGWIATWLLATLWRRFGKGWFPHLAADHPEWIENNPL